MPHVPEALEIVLKLRLPGVCWIYFPSSDLQMSHYKV